MWIRKGIHKEDGKILADLLIKLLNDKPSSIHREPQKLQELEISYPHQMIACQLIYALLRIDLGWGRRAKAWVNGHNRSA
jgi:hypothetical protein